MTALSSNAVAGIVQRRAGVAEIDGAAYAGYATSAAQAGIGEIRIVAQTRHASLAVLGRYVREGRLFEQNLAAKISL